MFFVTPTFTPRIFKTRPEDCDPSCPSCLTRAELEPVQEEHGAALEAYNLFRDGLHSSTQDGHDYVEEGRRLRAYDRAFNAVVTAYQATTVLTRTAHFVLRKNGVLPSCPEIVPAYDDFRADVEATITALRMTFDHFQEVAIHSAEFDRIVQTYTMLNQKIASFWGVMDDEAKAREEEVMNLI